MGSDSLGNGQLNSGVITLDWILSSDGNIIFNVNDEYLEQIFFILLRSSIIVDDASEHGDIYKRFRILIFSYLSGNKRYAKNAVGSIFSTNNVLPHDWIGYLLNSNLRAYAGILSDNYDYATSILDEQNANKQNGELGFFSKNNRFSPKIISSLLTLYGMSDMMRRIVRNEEISGLALRIEQMSKMCDSRLHHIATWLPISVEIGNRRVNGD